MTIPISRPEIGPEEEEAVLRVLRSGRLAQGPEVEALEEAFAQICGVPHAIACANGTAALHLALLAEGIGPGDEVLIPTFTFAATANAVVACGARPVFCDVSEDDFMLSLTDAQARLGRATRAIMPVHLYGQVGDMAALTAFAAEHDLAIIEDACQAHGARRDGRAAGSFGTAAFSFYATKNAMSGEGGIVTAVDDDVADRLRLLRNHGMRERYVHLTFGLNLRMTEIAAAMGRTSVARLLAGNARRAEHAAFYATELGGIDGLVLPVDHSGGGHAWHQYTVRVLGGRRDAVLARLRDAGIGADVYYPTCVHKQPAYASDLSLPVAERLATEVLSIPVYPGLSDGERAQVAKALADAVREV